ncbi:hypothetical protein Leryth_011024 [Lithospermum erythrorhizon]|uniref:Uncharacterized protein n=1 Tax=Lithospermum erythrorhizon TaxID=34254 RepID=A0AAV3QNJ5_LITER|nr:hypothetical protein Leryth_011024 [Lithospermum erythrorhizon]
MTTGASVLFQCVFHGSISISDMEIERRPYHRYCSCAFHQPKDGTLPSHCSKRRHMPFCKKQGCSLSLHASEMPSKWSFLSASKFCFHSLLDNKRHDE